MWRPPDTTGGRGQPCGIAEVGGGAWGLLGASRGWLTSSCWRQWRPGPSPRLLRSRWAVHPAAPRQTWTRRAKRALQALLSAADSVRAPSLRQARSPPLSRGDLRAEAAQPGVGRQRGGHGVGGRSTAAGGEGADLRDGEGAGMPQPVVPRDARCVPGGLDEARAPERGIRWRPHPCARRSPRAPARTWGFSGSSWSVGPRLPG